MDITKVFIFGVIIISVAGAAHHHVQAGTNISLCGLICYQPSGILYLQCRHKPSLFAAKCIDFIPEVIKGDEERFNGSNGCFIFTNVQQNDTCVYQIKFYGNNFTKVTSKTIIILDSVKILKITSNFSHMGIDTALHVQSSGEEATVSWEVDGLLYPPRYHFVDNNRTLIIKDIKEEDITRKFVVRIKNPISEDFTEFYLEIQGNRPTRSHLPAILSLTMFTVVVLLLLLYHQLKKRKKSRVQTKEPLVNGYSEV